MKELLNAIPTAGASAYALAALVVILVASIVGSIWKSSARKRSGRGVAAERTERSLVTVSIVGSILLFVVAVVAIRESRREPQPIVQRQEIVPDALPKEPPPAPKTYDVSISSVPHGARIFVDGNDWGITPNTVKLAAGRREIRLVKRGYEPLQDVLVVPEQLVLSPELTAAK